MFFCWLLYMQGSKVVAVLVWMQSKLFSLDTAFCKGLRGQIQKQIKILITMSNLYVHVPSETHQNPKVIGPFYMFTGSKPTSWWLWIEDFLHVYRTVTRKFQALVIFCLLTGCAVHSPLCRQTEVYLVIGKSSPKYLLSWQFIWLACHALQSSTNFQRW